MGHGQLDYLLAQLVEGLPVTGILYLEDVIVLKQQSLERAVQFCFAAVWL